MKLPCRPRRTATHLLIEHDPIASSADKKEAKKQKVIPKKGFSDKYYGVFRRGGAIRPFDVLAGVVSRL